MPPLCSKRSSPVLLERESVIREAGLYIRELFTCQPFPSDSPLFFFEERLVVEEVCL